MPLRFDNRFSKEYLPPSFDSDRARAAFLRLKAAKEEGLPVDWMTLPKDYDKEEFSRILDAAQRIRAQSEVFVVIGIGGSYLGARAAIEFLYGQEHNLSKDAPQIFFAGNSLDPDESAALLDYCRDKEVSINVISKSGTTTEPAVAFRLWRKLLEEKYGEAAKERIFVTTDQRVRPGTLRELAEQKGYECFVVPDGIGGRYSVLSAVGLLPIAVSGADISAMMHGARDAMERYRDFSMENDCVRYAMARTALYESGKSVELFASFHPRMQLFGEWLKQLFGESEGKEHKALYPASVVYSTDLHSMGQYVQEGARVFFETMLEIGAPNTELLIPDDPKNTDGLNFLSGKTLGYVNDKAQEATIAAHAAGNAPVLEVRIDKADEYGFGELVYFFELSVAISGYLIDVNPFDQPGVEFYKRNMFKLLGKPGY